VGYPGEIEEPVHRRGQQSGIRRGVSGGARDGKAPMQLLAGQSGVPHRPAADFRIVDQLQDELGPGLGIVQGGVAQPRIGVVGEAGKARFGEVRVGAQEAPLEPVPVRSFHLELAGRVSGVGGD